jgi:tetratricopeptide (TPR) repeat protein
MGAQSKLLKNVCIFGLIILLVLLALLVFLSRYGDIPLFSPFLDSFSRELENYDKRLADAKSGNQGLPLREAFSLLNKLEKKAPDIEGHLSVLKRRRDIALGRIEIYEAQEGAANEYLMAAGRVRNIYPHSGQIGALRAESFVVYNQYKSSSLLGIYPWLPSEEAEKEVRDISVLLYDGALRDLALGFSVYSGEMGDPATARRVPADLFTLLCSVSDGAERERYLINNAIRILFEDKIPETITMINAIIAEQPLLDETYLFAAEFFYDHGNFARAAELFSHFDDDQGLARQADALWLAGFADSAGTLWRIVVTGGSGITAESRASDIRARSIYNLAALASSPQDERQWLETLFADNPSYEPGRIFGVIRFSRLSVLDRAIGILERTDRSEGLFDLELLRRNSEDWAVDKSIAEAWGLVNRHPGNEGLFQWAAWFFDFERRYSETALLVHNAERNGIAAPWLELHKAFALIREDNLNEAENILLAVEKGSGRYGGFWQIPANLGLIQDVRRNPRGALELYETAAGMEAALVNRLRGAEKVPGVRVPEPAAEVADRCSPPELQDAARVQLRIARCLRSLGRESESRRALDYALDLDPDNIEAALEKKRLESRGIL